MRKWIGFILTVCLLLTVAGCGQGDKETQKDSESVGETLAQDDGYPREITNYDGEVLKLDKKPEQIASLVFGTDEMLLSLTDLSNIVGLSGKDNGCAYLSPEGENAGDIQRINDNAEVLISLKPDFIIGSSWVDEDLLAQIKDSQIPYYGYVTPTTLEEQIQVIKDLGYLLGEDEKTSAIVEDMETRIQSVVDKASAIAQEDKVKVMAYNMHESTNAKGTIFDDMVTKAGAINLSSEAGLEGTAKISKEQIVEMNPDVIILLEWASDTDDAFNAFKDELLSDDSLKEVNAIKNQRVYVSTDNSITNISQFTVNGLEFIAQSCYPEVFK